MLITTTSYLSSEVLNLFPDTIILNLSSLNEAFPRVALMPPPDLHFMNDEVFDQNYFNYIFNNDLVFLELMKIIIPLYYGQNICLLVTQNEIFDKITESLLKLIQQRYGYNGIIINEAEDLLMLDTPVYEDGEFSLGGLAMLGLDKERYTYITTSMQIDQSKGDYNHGY